MGTQAQQLLQNALSLAPNERAEIAASLIHSLDREVDDDIDAAWAEEIRRRLDDIDEGKVSLIPGDQVVREMRERLDA